MPDATPILGLALALGLVFAATPVAIRVAARLEFYDKPVGYKGHARPTPYLGGAPVVAAFVAVLLVLTTDWSRSLPVIGGVVVLWVVGTIDDKWSLSPGIRVGFEAALAAVVFALGLGWDLGAGAVVDLGATIVWVVAVVNALNLFDNMDGAATSIAAVISAAVAALALSSNDIWLAVAGAALAGACMGFLPHNLRSPARIFLGDGGSMPIGFALAVLVMAAAGSTAAAWQAFAIGILLVGIPALDTALVIVSRRRRGVPVLQGGRDHLTHRAIRRLHTARAVAFALGATQAVLAALALVAAGRSSGALVVIVALYLAGAATAIVVLDRQPAGAVAASTAEEPSRAGAWDRVKAGGALSFALGCCAGVAPFFEGYYNQTVWAPMGLVVIVLATAAWVARPLRISVPGVVVLGGAAVLGVLSVVSSSWAGSAENAVVSGNRYLTYAALLALLVAVVRSRAAAVLALAGFVSAAVGVAGWDAAQMLSGDAREVFLGTRLNAPLDYINGQANFFLLAAWPCIAVCAWRRSPVAGALGLTAATALLGLAFLGQSRGAILSCLAAVVLVLVVARSRLRLAAMLALIAAGIAAALPQMLDVFDASRTDVSEAAARGAMQAILLAAAAVGVLAFAALTLERRMATRSPGLHRRGRTVLAFAAAALAAATIGGLVAKAGPIADEVRDQYHAFVHLDATQGSESSRSRLVSGGGNRYDYWRVAASTFGDNPVVGVGAGNYVEPYFRERRTAEDIRQPHSLQLQTLSELGMVGGLVLLTIVAGVVMVFWRWRRRAAGSDAETALMVAGAGILAAWLAHSSVDWIHLLPGLSAAALIAVAIAIRGAAGDANANAVAKPQPAQAGARVRRVLAPALAALLLAVAGISLSRQSLSDWYRMKAQDALATSPVEAIREANRSLRLDADAVQSYYVKAAATARLGDAGLTVRILEDAVAREPENYLTYALLGDVYARDGRYALARSAYADALERNPRSPDLRALVDDPRAAVRGSE